MIRSKKDIPRFIEIFEKFSNWDGNKYYLTLNTVNPAGTVTLMKYQDGTFSYHRKNEVFWDISEIEINNGELIQMFWDYRKYINKCLKEAEIQLIKTT